MYCRCVDFTPLHSTSPPNPLHFTLFHCRSVPLYFIPLQSNQYHPTPLQSGAVSSVQLNATSHCMRTDMHAGKCRQTARQADKGRQADRQPLMPTDTQVGRRASGQASKRTCSQAGRKASMWVGLFFHRKLSSNEYCAKLQTASVGTCPGGPGISR